LIDRHRVLVIEDDPMIRDVLVEVLADHGYEAVGAANGREALDTLAQPDDPPCVILLDLMMPVMDGHSFRQEQLQSPELSDIPVVVISAFVDQTTTDELHADDYLKKPVRLHEVLGAVRRHCQPSSG
jgi:CheY-like chemotaxis protein